MNGHRMDNPYDISFSCVCERQKLTLHLRTALPAAGYLWAGVLKSIATRLFRVAVNIYVTLLELKGKTTLRYHFCFSLPMDGGKIKSAMDMPRGESLLCFQTLTAASGEAADKSADPSASNGCPFSQILSRRHQNDLTSYIGMSTFCRAFPWHFMIDRHLNLVQLGSGFMRLFGADLKTQGRHLSTFFDIHKPKVEADFLKFVKKANGAFILALRNAASDVTRKTQLQVTGNRVCPGP